MIPLCIDEMRAKQYCQFNANFTILSGFIDTRIGVEMQHPAAPELHGQILENIAVDFDHENDICAHLSPRLCLTHVSFC